MAKTKNGTMKLSELVRAEPALAELANQKMKAKASFRLAKVVNQVSPHLESFRKIQQELLEKHGTKNGEGYSIEPQSKSFKTYISEIEAVLEEEVNVSINLKGREWINPQGEAKYFNAIQGWRIESVQTAPKQDTPPLQSDVFEPQGTGPDDMPY